MPPLLLHVGPSACATPTRPSPPRSALSSKSLSALPLPPPLIRAKEDGFYRLSVSPSRAARGGSSADADDVITTLSFPLPPDIRGIARVAALESALVLGSQTALSSRSHLSSPFAPPPVPIPEFVSIFFHHDRSRSEELPTLYMRHDDPSASSARGPAVAKSRTRSSRRTESPPTTSSGASYSIRSCSRMHEAPLAESTACTSQQVSTAADLSIKTTSSSPSAPSTRVRSVSWARNVAPGWSLRAEQQAWAEAWRGSARRRPPLLENGKEWGIPLGGASRIRIVGVVISVLVLAVVILLVVILAIALGR